MIIYHNPKCRKSRAGLEYVKQRDNSVIVKEYIREGILPEEIGKLAQMLNIKPFEMVRTQEDYYRDVLKGKEISDEQWLAILSEYPRLLRRPILVNGDRAVIADPAEKADEII